MKLAGYDVEDVNGNGIQGFVRLTGLTLLFGKNASGKTTLLETLVSLLDPNTDWLGRRARLDDESYAFGQLFLSGSWEGADWDWLRGFMGYQNDDEGLADAYLLPAWNWPNIEGRSDLVRSAAEWFTDRATPGATQVLERALDLLTKNMLVSYSPWPYQVVYAVVDTATLADDTRSFLRDASENVGNSILAQRLRDIAESSEGYVDLMGLGVLVDENFEEHALHPPSVIDVSAGDLDAEAVLDAALFSSRVTNSNDAWASLVSTGDGRYATNPKIVEALADLQQVVSDGPIPAFVLEQGSPEISIPTPELWSQHGRVLLGLRTPTNTWIDIRKTSAAVARWIQVLVVLAVDDWLRSDLKSHEAINWVGGVPVVTRVNRRLEGRVLVVDEPEVHLHPVAQSQIADWLIHTAESGTTVLAATHSPPIINAYSDNVTLVGVHREAGHTTLLDLMADALTALDDAAAMLGSDRAGWLQIARGILLVEGEHDVAVVNHFYGRELKALRVAVVPIRGHNNLHGTVVSEFFGGMGIPIRVLLDDVRAAATLGDDSIQPSSSEEKVIRQLKHQMGRFPNLDVVAYQDPDIICALPMVAICRAWPGALEVAWLDIIDSWRSLSKATGFKPYALKRLRLKVSSDDFVSGALASTLPGEKPSDELNTAMETLIASLR